MTKKVEIMQNIFTENEILSRKILDDLNAKRILAINVMGAPGVGKTSVIMGIIRKISPDKIYVIEGDVESDIDTKNLVAKGIEAYQINTYGGCHLDSIMLDGIYKKIQMQNDSIVFIENIGNLICPAEFEIGDHLRILICSVTDGSDKPYKYPLAFKKADALIINKNDLKNHVDFDFDFFMEGIRAVNKNLKIFHVSAKGDEGFGKVAEWVLEKKKAFFNS